MSKIAEEKARKEYYATIMEENAFISGYDQSAKDVIARIEKWAEQNTNNAHDMPNRRKDKMFYEGEDSMICKLFLFLSELEKEYEGLEN